MGKTPRLHGKVAIVTGASQGLGQYLSMELATEGAQVVLAARNRERLEDTRGRIESAGGTAMAMPVDVQREVDCEFLISETLARFGHIDQLVLNAGAATYGKLEELENFSPIRDSMSINFFGAAYPTYLAIKPLIATKGIVVYVTSGAGHLPMAGYLGYTTSKHAMNGFFEALRLEMYPHGVDVLAINPGDMYSDDGAGRSVLLPEGRELKVDLSIKRENDIQRTPASVVAKKCLEAIVARKRELNLSPTIQKVGTVLRAVVPDMIDHRIYKKTAQMRSAFAGIEAELRAERDRVARAET